MLCSPPMDIFYRHQQGFQLITKVSSVFGLETKTQRLIIVTI